MQVFSIQVLDGDIRTALERVYRTELAILRYDFEFHCQVPPHRLALVTAQVQTHAGIKTLGFLVKESSRYELIMLSLMNKLLPYSCPKVIYYVEELPTMWIFLENISTWVDIGGRHRVYETLIDGLYVVHAAFLDNTQALLDNFPFPIVTKEVLLRAGRDSLVQVDKLSANTSFVGIFKECGWDEKAMGTILEKIKTCVFPMTTIHRNYCPNTARAIRDTQGRVHVVVYDWQNAAVGWPQVDLVLLLDRLDILARSQKLPKPSPVLLQRFAARLVDEFDINPEMFYEVYRVCYLCRMLPLMKWWMSMYLQFPSRDPERVFLEVRSKLEMMSTLKEGK